MSIPCISQFISECCKSITVIVAKRHYYSVGLTVCEKCINTRFINLHIIKEN